MAALPLRCVNWQILGSSTCTLMGGAEQLTPPLEQCCCDERQPAAAHPVPCQCQYLMLELATLRVNR